MSPREKGSPQTLFLPQQLIRVDVLKLCCGSSRGYRGEAAPVSSVVHVGSEARSIPDCCLLRSDGRQQAIVLRSVFSFCDTTTSRAVNACESVLGQGLCFRRRPYCYPPGDAVVGRSLYKPWSPGYATAASVGGGVVNMSASFDFKNVICPLLTGNLEPGK